MFIKQTTTQPITEEIQQPVQQQSNVPQYSSQIDYPMIRTIVEEIVRKYTSAINKKLINENKQSSGLVNTIALGETFKFLDNEGNIYECKMKKVGNIKNKKSTI